MIDGQERLWTETAAEDPAEEVVFLRGGENVMKIDPKMYHGIKSY